MISEDLVIPANFAGSAHYFFAIQEFSCTLYVIDLPPNVQYLGGTVIGTISYNVTGIAQDAVTHWTGNCPEYTIQAGHRLLFTNDSNGNPGTTQANTFSALTASFPMHRA